MKKILSFLVCTFLCSNIAFANSIVYEKPDVKIIVEGEELQLETEVPIIVNSRTLVPLRKLLVGLGVPDNTTNIQWIGETREVKVVYNGITIDLAIDNSKGYINGQEYTLDAAPIIHRDRTYLPARFVGEALDYTVSWDAHTPAVLVTSNKNMDKLTQILNDLNTAMNNVNSYELASVRKTSVDSTYNGDTQNFSYTNVTLEKADLGKNIIYSENSFTEGTNESYSFTYNTDDAFYSCGLEGKELYSTGWEKYPYEPGVDFETPFNSKGKLGLMNFDYSLYGSLLCDEYKNAYVLTSVSNQVDILKSLDGMDLYNEVEGKEVENFYFKLAVSKDTNLPLDMEIKYDVVFEEIGENNSYTYKSVEKNEYVVEFLNYNHYLELELPSV